MRTRATNDNFGTLNMADVADSAATYEYVEVEATKEAEQADQVARRPRIIPAPSPNAFHAFQFTEVTSNTRSGLEFSGSFNKTMDGAFRIVRNPSMEGAGQVFVTYRHVNSALNTPERALSKKELGQLKAALERQIVMYDKIDKKTAADLKSIVSLVERAIVKASGLNPINQGNPPANKYGRFIFGELARHSRSGINFSGIFNKTGGGDVRLNANSLLRDRNKVYFQPTRNGKPYGNEVELKESDIRAMRDGFQAKYDSAKKKDKDLATVIGYLTRALVPKNPPVTA